MLADSNLSGFSPDSDSESIIGILSIIKNTS